MEGGIVEDDVVFPKSRGFSPNMETEFPGRLYQGNKKDRTEEAMVYLWTLLLPWYPPPTANSKYRRTDTK